MGKFYIKEKIERLKNDIRFEIILIEETIDRIKELKTKLPVNKTDHATEPAIGTYLMNFYNGIENIIKRICKFYYHCFPKGDAWHKELLQLSCNPPTNKIAVFSKDTVKTMNKYLNFRHRFISGYGFQQRNLKHFYRN